MNLIKAAKKESNSEMIANVWGDTTDDLWNQNETSLPWRQFAEGSDEKKNEEKKKGCNSHF